MIGIRNYPVQKEAPTTGRRMTIGTRIILRRITNREYQISINGRHCEGWAPTPHPTPVGSRPNPWGIDIRLPAKINIDKILLTLFPLWISMCACFPLWSPTKLDEAMTLPMIAETQLRRTPRASLQRHTTLSIQTRTNVISAIALSQDERVVGGQWSIIISGD